MLSTAGVTNLKHILLIKAKYDMKKKNKDRNLISNVSG